jgi:hypothetical protein
MPKYVITRPLPGAHKLSADELTAISKKSNAVLREQGPDVQWIQSYVVEDAILCVYFAKNPDLVKEHARLGGFPCERIAQVATIIDPGTGGA